MIVIIVVLVLVIVIVVVIVIVIIVVLVLVIMQVVGVRSGRLRLSAVFGKSVTTNRIELGKTSYS